MKNSYFAILACATTLFCASCSGVSQETPQDVTTSLFNELVSLRSKMEKDSPQGAIQKNGGDLLNLFCIDNGTVKTFLSKNKDATAEILLSNMAEELADYCPIEKFKVGEVEFRGTEATVNVSFKTPNSKRFTGEVWVAKIDEKWYIDDFDFNEDESVAHDSSYSDDSSESDDNSSDSNASSSDSASEDMDALIDSYEEYVTDYIKLMKKAQAGDMTAMTEYPALLENAQDLQNKLNKSQGDMSTAQAARFSRIITKMASAASAM